MLPFKPTTQEEESGCAVACIASLLGISYKKSKKLVGKDYNVLVGMYAKGIVKVLKKVGLNYEYKKVTPKTKKYLNQIGSIIFIKRSKRFIRGHYLIKTEKGFMDPWINNPYMNPAKAGFEKKLPGIPQWIIYKNL
ncbi:MAG: cysteine peptidase family C39 domain-containing protein [archaeon]